VLTLAYIVLAVVGCGYVLFASVLGHVGDAQAHGHEASDGASYGVSGGGHGVAKASEGGGASFHFPFFSPLALATLAAAVGAYGLIAQYGVGVSGETSLLVAVPAALATAYAVTYVSWRLVHGSRGTSAISLAEIAGAHGEVITPIPAGGVGEVATLVGSQRFTAPARDADGREVPRGTAVVVLRMTGTTLVVTERRSEEGRAHG
jgi:membrane protein implicated in regulation of membrane protease activity